MGRPPTGNASPPKKRSSRAPPSMESLDYDILCNIFSFLGLLDLVRCSAVCKPWNSIIKRSRLLYALYLKQQQRRSVLSEESLSMYLQDLAMENHRLALTESSRLEIHQWKGHSLGVDQCGMRMGLVLTGVGDKFMHLWSLESYKCVEDYHVPDAAPLLDFEFDESKIVGLVGT